MPRISWNKEDDRKLLIQLEPPTLVDALEKPVAQYLAAKFQGATYKSVAKRVIELRAETKADHGSLSAPGTIEETRTPATSAAAAAAAAARNLPPPGAATPTRPRGQPWEPLSPFLSPITGRWFTIDAAPNRPKRFRSDSYDDDESLNEDEEGTPAPKRLKWNIHDRFNYMHVRKMHFANVRANLRQSLLLEEETREAEAREAEIREADLGEEAHLTVEEDEIIDLVSPTTTTSITPEIIDLVTPTTTTPIPEIVDLVTPTATESSFDRP